MAKARRSYFSQNDRTRTLDAIEALRRCLGGVCAGHAFQHEAAEAARRCFDVLTELETALTGSGPDWLRNAHSTPPTRTPYKPDE